jgi:predicted dehydrogenase/threonine dehydrogenase-like Zn-dependent dehydrogenase
MKQLLQNMRSGETTVAEVPIPLPKPGSALVRTAASLVSAGTERMVVEFAEKSLVGKARSRPDLVRQVLDKARREGLLTTMDAAFNRLDQPMALGYSSAGTIVDVGAGLEGFSVGQRVACAGGGYAVHAEYEVVPQNLITPLPDQVDFESAAFATLGAIAMHGFRLAEPQLGERIAVVGLGLLGLLTVGVARAAGCHVLGIDLDPRRVNLARELGSEAVLREGADEAAQSFSRGRGCDAVLICADTSSPDPVELAGAIARDRAHVVATGAVGLHLPRKVYYEKELSFINSRSYGPGRYDPSYEEAGRDYPIGYVRWTEGRNLEAFVDLLASGRLDVRPLITHRFPIERAPSAYELITGKKGEPFLGVLLTYHDTPTQVDRSRSNVVQTQEPKQRPPTSSKVGIGVLGAGNFAVAVLLPALKKIPTVELVGIASASGLSAQHAAQRFGFHYASSEEAQILNDPEISTVAILTRHNLHARQVIAALSAGKHVFCEKPLALRDEDLREIAEALTGKGEEERAGEEKSLPSHRRPLLTVGFNRRFAPLAQRLGAFIRERKEPLVAHYRVNAGYIPLTHWIQDSEQGGGRIIGEGCHFVDFLTFLVGSSPVSVSAQGLPDAGRYREDNVVLNYTFQDGSIGLVIYLANGDKAFPKERIEVFSGGRIAVLDDYRTLEMVHNGRREVVRSRLRQDKGHRAEWEAFAAAIHTGGPPPIPYEQLFGVTRATFAAVQALRTGTTLKIE